MAKRFIKEIIYSGENIKINLFYSGNFKNFSVGKSPARLQAGGAEIPSDNKESLVFSNKTKFVSETTSADGGNRTYFVVPVVGLEPTNLSLMMRLL